MVKIKNINSFYLRINFSFNKACLKKLSAYVTPLLAVTGINVNIRDKSGITAYGYGNLY